MASPSSPDNSMSRRGFLKSGATAGAALGLAGMTGLPAAAHAPDHAGPPDHAQGPPDPFGIAPPRTPQEQFMGGVPFERHETVRVGLVGLGMRGGGMITRFLQQPGVQVTALCDINPTKLSRDRNRVINAGQPEPATFLGDEGYEQLVQRDNIDFIYDSSPWEHHYWHSMAAMLHGIHIGTEIPLATKLKEFWDLIRTSERTRRHCFTFHNRSYGLPQLRMLRLVDEGRIGEVLFASGGYIHDLRSLNFSNSHEPTGWRRRWHTRMNTNHYPVHGLAPASNALRITRGDRYDTLTSVTTPESGYSKWREERMPANHPSWEDDYISGDTNQALITTVKGKFLRTEHDVASPHPYSRANELQGSMGKLTEIPTSSSTDQWYVYLEPDHSNHAWRPFNDYPQYNHWLWTQAQLPSSVRPAGLTADANQMVVYRTMQLLKLGLPPDNDIYDSAYWSCPVPLCEESLKRGSRPVKVPDFTRGNWEGNRPNMNSVQPEEL